MGLNRQTVMTSLLLPFLITYLSFWSQFGSSYGLTMFAPIDTLNMTGNITFFQAINTSVVTVAINLELSKGITTPLSFNWKIMSLPYHLENPCSESALGTVKKDMSAQTIQVPSQTFGTSFTDADLSLYGPKTIWLSSIIFQPVGQNVHGCTNILLEGEVTTYEAQFLGPEIGGIVYLRSFEDGPTQIFSQLAYTEDTFRANSQHDWKILSADALSPNQYTITKCHHLKDIFDPEDKVNLTCSTSNPENCTLGDLTKKHGQITIYNDNGAGKRQKFTDPYLHANYFASFRANYIVIYQKNDTKKPLACALIAPLNPKQVKAYFDMDGVKGYIGFNQNFHTDPTIVTINLKNLKGRGNLFKIHQFPVDPMLEIGEKICSHNALGSMYNPYGHQIISNPGLGSTERYPAGDLSGKYGSLTSQEDNNMDVFAVHVDLFLPLFGRHSIIGRSVVIHKADGSEWICATIGYPAYLTTAVATFHYPIAGKIIFRQESHAPNTETTVYVDLSYSDETANDTSNHAWHIHVKPPGTDFYNWTGRCLSTGDHYNPNRVGVKKYTYCRPDNPYRCEMGDNAKKAGVKISIAAHRGSKLVKLFYTDPVLHLAGPYSILGRSVVVHDDHGPAQRGDRLACAPIKVLHPLQAAAREWKTTNGVSPVTGSAFFFQSSIHDGTDVTIKFDGLDGQAGGYHVHKVSVPIDAEFPCAMSAVQGHFNPFAISVNISIPPGVGSVDQYEIGDISGKKGKLDKKQLLRLSYMDQNLPLFGMNSIIGRSMVIHYADGGLWVCASIKAEVKSEEGKEIIAIASFHDSRHLITGYLRFRQFEYKDGSTSDTWIDVDLRHAGAFNRNVTKDHKWEIFVNQVGAEAYQPTESVRCLGGGFIWNPLQTVKKSMYKKDCSKVNPLRCQLGDLTGRHGFLEIGGPRKLFTDVNLPLTGPYSVVGRSLIIYTKGETAENKIACTNIVLDQHLKLSVSLRKTSGFTLDKFMDQMRGQLRTTDWLVIADLQSYAVVFGDTCIIFNVHFYGPKAKMLNDAFNKLIQIGTTAYSDEQGTYVLTTPYKACNPTSASVSGSGKLILSSIVILVAMVGLAIAALIIHQRR